MTLSSISRRLIITSSKDKDVSGTIYFPRQVDSVILNLLVISDENDQTELRGIMSEETINVSYFRTDLKV